MHCKTSKSNSVNRQKEINFSSNPTEELIDI